jgi:hypothetical protein
MNSEGFGSYSDISPADSHFFPSAGLNDAHATYLAAVFVLGYCALMVWINRKDLS